MESLDRTFSLLEQLGKFGVVIFRREYILSDLYFFRFAQARFADRFNDSNRVCRITFLLAACTLAGVNDSDQPGDHRYTDKERTTDHNTGDNAYGQAFPVLFGIAQKPQKALRLELVIIIFMVVTTHQKILILFVEIADGLNDVLALGSGTLAEDRQGEDLLGGGFAHRIVADFAAEGLEALLQMQ